MAADMVKLLHSVPHAKLDAVRREGLKASSAFSDLGVTHYAVVL